VWWYYTGTQGKRTRGVEKVCRACDSTYPTRESWQKEFCSMKCYHGSRTRDPELYGRDSGWRQDEHGEWWLYKKHRYRQRGRVSVCQRCGKEFQHLANFNPEYCSRSCGVSSRRGSRSPSWKGGRVKHHSGYIYVSAPDHPRKWKAGYVAEHRLVMERHLGRYLEPRETVHHLNGDRSDNRLENLQLRRGRHGRGVSMKCLDCGSHNVAHAEL
jgi:hypothetical protein